MPSLPIWAGSLIRASSSPVGLFPLVRPGRSHGASWIEAARAVAILSDEAEGQKHAQRITCQDK